MGAAVAAFTPQIHKHRTNSFSYVQLHRFDIVFESLPPFGLPFKVFHKVVHVDAGHISMQAAAFIQRDDRAEVEARSSDNVGEAEPLVV